MYTWSLCAEKRQETRGWSNNATCKCTAHALAIMDFRNFFTLVFYLIAEWKHFYHTWYFKESSLWICTTKSAMKGLKFEELLQFAFCHLSNLPKLHIILAINRDKAAAYRGSKFTKQVLWAINPFRSLWSRDEQIAIKSNKVPPTPDRCFEACLSREAGTPFFTNNLFRHSPVRYPTKNCIAWGPFINNIRRNIIPSTPSPVVNVTLAQLINGMSLWDAFRPPPSPSTTDVMYNRSLGPATGRCHWIWPDERAAPLLKPIPKATMHNCCTN